MYRRGARTPIGASGNFKLIDHRFFNFFPANTNCGNFLKFVRCLLVTILIDGITSMECKTVELSDTNNLSHSKAILL